MRQGSKKRWLPQAKKTPGLFKKSGGGTQSRLKLSKLNDSHFCGGGEGGGLRFHRSATDLLGVQLGRFPLHKATHSGPACALPSRLSILTWGWICSKVALSSLICTEVLCGLSAVPRRATKHVCVSLCAFLLW